MIKPNNSSLTNVFRGVFVLLVLVGFRLSALAQNETDLKYPISNGESNNSMDIQPTGIEYTVEYDIVTNKYILHKTLNGKDLEPPMYMTYQEYMDYVSKQQNDAYFKSRSNAGNLVQGKGVLPPIDTKIKFFDRLFGGSKIDIRPSGNIEVTLGGNSQKVANPTLPSNVQKQGGFDFDMDINMNVVGKIGNKLQLNLGYNTQQGFSFGSQQDNNIKLAYEGEEDDIIQLIEAGSVSLPLKTQLITGSQALFGIKTKLRFGRLTMTSVISQQKSKKESIVLENGVQTQRFQIDADNYDQNRHFFLSQYFYNTYDQSLKNLPNISSVAQINQLEVWVTNRSGATQNIRDVVCLMDLGEPNPYQSSLAGTASGLPDNDANNLYRRLSTDPNNRTIDNCINVLQSDFGLTQVQDFEKVFARKLSPSEYTFDPVLGYISLNTYLNPNEVLGVAYQYTYNGEVHQVGELSSQIQTDSTETSKVLYLKMLKSTSVRPQLPIWNLMMKNIYSLGAYQISNEDFFLDIYYNDPGKGVVRYLPKGNLQGIPLIRLLNLDNLNNQGDAQPDGIFDFIPSVTIKPNNGRLIFPVVQPFGDALRKKFEDAGDAALAGSYVYDQLYDSTQVIAQQFPEYNRFIIKGQYKSSAAGDISLGAFNVPQGSVTVSAGGQVLQEGVHYQVDYNLGRVKILDESILNSGQQIKIDFENNALFGFQQKSLYGTRLDFRVNDKLNIGGTVMHMSERPLTQKVNIGDDPIRNTIFGLDVNYNTEAPIITKILDKLPVYSTKDVSTVSAYGEVARLQPGHSKAVGKDGIVYIDDFEGSNSGYDIRLPIANWKLASTPRNSPDENGANQFPEADLLNDLRYGINRAKLSWYNIDPLFPRASTGCPEYIANNPDLRWNHYVREVLQTEVFPNKSLDGINNTITTLNLTYYPDQRGPYNFEWKATGEPGLSFGVDANGNLKNPRSRWAGIMRNLENTDFEASNVEYIEFWVMDPFIYNDNPSRAGELYINIGNVSEDVLRDSRMLYENGLSDDPNKVDETAWGKVPRLPQIVSSFDNDPDKRILQDVGYDGLTDDDERTKFEEFLTNAATTITSTDALTKLDNDPSSDNYRHFRDELYDNEEASVIGRYLNFNGPHGNSPVSQDNQNYSSAATNLPDEEDLNRDNSLNESEEYYQYRVPIFPGMNESNNKYIVSSVHGDATTQDGVFLPEYNWYQFRIPVREFDDRIGNIQDFRSIQFFRMFLTGFSDTTDLRFAKLELIRNQWRTYNGSLKNASDANPTDPDQETSFFITSVNIEENSEKEPVNYVLPPNIEREQSLGSSANTTIQLNEQAISVTTCGLKDGDSRAMYKNLNLDLRNYKNVRMYIHAEEKQPILNDNDLTAFLRIGSDFKDNYYQVEVPLKVTAPGVYTADDAATVWPDANTIDLALEELTQLKIERNNVGNPLYVPYQKLDDNGRILTIVGNPDLGMATTVMLGVHNPEIRDQFNPQGAEDDGLSKCAEIWFNELRLSGFDENGGTATLANVNVKLADLGNVNFSTQYHSIGYGQLEDQLDKRYQDTYVDYNFSTALNLGKFIPDKLGFQIPFYGSYAQKFSTPEYDPYQLDIKLKEQFNQMEAFYGKDSVHDYRRQVQSIETRKGYNFTNVRVVPKNTKRAPMPWSPGNFSFTYAYNVIEKSDPFIASDLEKNYLGELTYNYAPQPKFWTPFKKAIKSGSPWYGIIKDFNINLIPSTLGFSTQMRRQYGELQLRQLGGEDFPIDPTFNKFFVWDRNYNFAWSPFKSLNFNFSAVNNARIDEPYGKIDTKEEKNEIWNNVLKFGRNTNYTQNFNASYNLPIYKIPAFDWIQIKGDYASNYNWTASSLVRNQVTDELEPNPLGNIITNGQKVGVNGTFNFKKLYDKSPFLKVYNNPNPNQGDKEKRKKYNENVEKQRNKLDADLEKAQNLLDKSKEELKEVKENESLEADAKKAQIKAQKKKIKTLKKNVRRIKKDRRSKQQAANPLIAAVVQPIMAIKNVSLNYSETRATTLPGYAENSRILGNSKINSPGYDFAFGMQPGMNPFSKIDPAERDKWLDEAASKGWISSDTLLNQQFMQTYAQSFNATATLEPWRDIKIDLNIKRDYAINHSELFKKVTADGDYEHLVPTDMGSYTISTIPVKTMFKKYDDNWVNETYKQFEANREVIAARMAAENPNSTGGAYYNPNDSTFNGAYKEGYGPKSQDVLIPAFISAYTGQNPNKAKLNPLENMPLPNWRISYNGLTKFGWAKDIFTSFSLTHAYNSTLSVNSFQTNLDYLGDGTYFTPSSIDSLNGNFYSLYRIPDVVISEQFSPLIGLRMAFKNNVTADFDYKKSRTLGISFADYQLVETNSTSWSIGLGYKIRGLKLPIKIKGKPIKLDNDLVFKVDFSYRDNVTVNHRIDQNTSDPTTGSRVLSLSPSIDYTVSKRINVRLFYDWSRTEPKTSAAFPTTTNKGGIKIRLSLAPN